MTARQLEQLYDEHAPSVFAFLLHLTRSEPQTRDLLQDVFARLARKPRIVIRNPRSYLLRSAHHAFVDHVRRESRRRQAVEDFRLILDEAWTAPEESPEAAALLDQLALLPAGQRAVLHLKIWEKMTFREIGRALGISPNTAASRHRYAIDKLRAALRPDSKNEPA